jgi:carboxyl-terminal processing protease
MRPTLRLRGASLLGLLATALLLPGLATAQAGPADPVTAEEKTAVLKDIETILGRDAYVPGVDFAKWSGFIDGRKEAIDKADTKGAFTNAVNGALQEFGFSHIVLFSPQAARARTDRKMVGLGVRIQPESNGIRVVFVFPDSPAKEVGIEPGDLIFQADGKPVRQPADLAGEEGSKVKVTVKRGDADKTFEVTRRTFKTDLPETLTWVDSKTAVLQIPTFDLGFNNERIRGLMVEAKKAENLVLDLRGNGGGQVINLVRLASWFLSDEQPLGTFISRSLIANYEKATGKKADDLKAVAEWSESKVRAYGRSDRYTGRVAVLINGGTGSASEMMAAALREHRGARVIGTKSAGAVLASLMRPISNGFMLQYPVTDYVTFKGLRIEGAGIVPDAEAQAVPFGQADPAIAEAVRWFAAAAKSG